MYLNRPRLLASTKNWSWDALESDKSMLTQASKAQQHGTNSIGMRPSSVVLQLFVSERLCFSVFLWLYQSTTFKRRRRIRRARNVFLWIDPILCSSFDTPYSTCTLSQSLSSYLFPWWRSLGDCDWHISLTEEIKWRCEPLLPLLLPPSLNSLTCLTRVHLCGVETLTAKQQWHKVYADTGFTLHKQNRCLLMFSCLCMFMVNIHVSKYIVEIWL